MRLEHDRRFGRTGPIQVLAVGLTTLVVGCDAFSEGLASNTDILARAAGHELSIDEAVDLLANQTQLPAEPQVVQALADLWVDYTLLTTVAQEDPELASLDLTPIVQLQLDQLAVFKLRDSVVTPDTIIPEDELRAMYEAELPGAEVRARHILLTFPDQATDEQRDSVRAFAVTLKERAEAGESFAQLAQRYSADPGSAREGGDLGFFDRDAMVEPFADAAFAAEAGEITDPVQSPYGIHVIKVEERRVKPFEEERDVFRGLLVVERVAEAESLYIASIEGPAEITVPEDAHAAARQIAARPEVRLSRRAARRALVEYSGGEYTASEFREYMQGRPPGFRNQVANGTDPQVEQLLRGLTRGELLVNEAEAGGFELTEQERDSLMVEARNRVVQAARTLGLWNVTPEPGESDEAAVNRTVMETLREILAGQEDVLPLGTIAFSLRNEYQAEVFDHVVPRVVEEVRAAGGGQSTQLTPTAPRPQFIPPPPGQRAPNAPPTGDTAGGG